MGNKNKENVDNVRKMTLEGYYKRLSTLAPRTAFIREIVRITGVTEPTVVNWVNGAKPQKYEHVIALSNVTGIKIEDLWER